MKRVLTWVVVGGAIAGLALWVGPRTYRAWAVHDEAEEKEGDNHGKEGGEDAPSSVVKVALDAAGHPLLTVEDEVRERIGLEVQPLAAATCRPHVKAYGRLEADPALSFTLRSPVAGFLDVDSSQRWPQVGDTLAASTEVGGVRPRLSPVEKYDLTARLMQARAEVEENRADLAAAKSSYENKKRLNELSKVVSDRTLEEAEVRFKIADAKMQAAVQTAQLLDDAIVRGGQQLSRIPLAIGPGGEVVEVLASPGEAVESGQSVVRVADYSRLLARVETSSDATPLSPPSTARVMIVGQESNILFGRVLAVAASSNMLTQGRSYMVSVDAAGQSIRPGIAVVAAMDLPGEPTAGVVVPRAAVVRYSGSAYVYVEAGKAQFVRLAIDVGTPLEAGWFVAEGLTVKNSVVVKGAGTLLSEELRSQIGAEEGDEE